MTDLPIKQIIPELMGAWADHNTFLLSAPPGSGKSTELPAILFERGLVNGKILLLQPRRMAARALAQRLSWRLNCQLGTLVGYRVRHQQLVSKESRLEVLTEGLLTRRLLSDPFLEGVGLVILDEFHERSAESDLALAALREAQEVSDLKIMVMSATLDSSLADYLPGAAVINLDYQPYPLDISYLPNANEPLEKRIYLALKNLLQDPADDGGDILVFLPGQKEIARTATFLESTALAGNMVIQQLYGALPAKIQDRVLNENELPEARRVILSTNIAQTSLTVPRVRAVIDAGLQKRAEYDQISGFNRLIMGRASQAAATQRSGRAARLGPGRAIRLWSKQDQLTMVPFDPPEIGTSDPGQFLIWMQAMQPGWYQKFPFISPLLNKPVWEEALAGLISLGIMAADGQRLTPLGEKISQYPLSPRLALLVEKSRQHNLELGCTIAALLAGRDIVTSGSPLTGDIEERLDLLAAWQQAGGQLGTAARFELDGAALKEFLDTLKQLKTMTGAPLGEGSLKYTGPELNKLLISCYHDHLAAQSANEPHDYTMVGNHGLRLEGAVNLQCPPYLLVLAARQGERHHGDRALIDLFLPISLEDLRHYCPDLITSSSEPYWDSANRAVVTATITRAASLEIERQRGGKADPEALAHALFAATRDYPRASYTPEEDIGQLELRYKLAGELRPDLELPPFAELFLAATQAACQNCRSFKDLKEAPWSQLILGQLAWTEQNWLKEVVPATYTLPRGQTVKISYEQDGNGQISASVAAHIQEFYGLKVHPTLGGRFPLKLILLAPNGRPAQITGDIVAFWRESYPAVRKDLFGRYPKHNWPEDPINAVSCGLGKRFKGM